MEKNLTICPLMSTADKKVQCTNECALYSFNKCAIVEIGNAIYKTSDTIDDLRLTIPTENE